MRGVSKYIIGADGGKSKVRKTAGIAFQGNNSGAKWIRMDVSRRKYALMIVLNGILIPQMLFALVRFVQAVVKTNMPSPRSLNSVQSAEHGLLLWCPIDGGRTRIGYVFSEKLQEKWGTVDGEGVTEEAIKEEARLAMKPFELEFEKVDWFTIYVGGPWWVWGAVRGADLRWVGSVGYWTEDGGAVYQGAGDLGWVGRG